METTGAVALAVAGRSPCDRSARPPPAAIRATSLWKSPTRSDCGERAISQLFAGTRTTVTHQAGAALRELAAA